MLIKISTGLPVKALHPTETPNFVLFDHAEQVEYGAAKDFDSESQLRSFFDHVIPGENLSYISPHTHHQLLNRELQLSKERRYLANEIQFVRLGVRHRVVFDGVAYICTDEGKTLERVYAGGPYSTDESANPST